MLTRELLSSVHRIEIRTRRLVNEIFSGQYGSVFRGLGMEFAEVREYSPGDEVRSIDWNVTARMGHPYVKKYVAEREMTVLLMMDGSASLQFGTAQKWKSELAAEVAAVLSFSAIRNNDKVGLCLFSDRVEKFIHPQKGRTHTLRVIRDVLEFSPEQRQTRMDEALRYVNRVLKRRAVVFLLSDFYGVNERLLAITNKRHDLIAVQILDPRERRWPNVGLVELTEAETGQRMVLDTSDRLVRRHFEQDHEQRQRALETLLHRHGIDHILLQTDQSFVRPLLQFFQARAKRFR
ncbi:MAG: DUF58 domain-containing protein [Elusimicrobiota bacterium]|jgi:uncharacterized protein (DUF58 family)